MAFDITIPTGADSDLGFSIDAGDILFVLGANGTGKSSLMQRLNGNHSANAWWISAHRQTWFTSGSVAMSPFQKHQVQSDIYAGDRQGTARWRDDRAAQRPMIAVFDLVNAENILARRIAVAARDGNENALKELVDQAAPIQVINELLRRSNMLIEISVDEDSNVIASKSGGAPYSIAELSDGERNALLIAVSRATCKTQRIAKLIRFNG